MTVIANILIVFTIVCWYHFHYGDCHWHHCVLPDVYTRAHAASKSATLGVLSILLGVFFHFWLNEGISVFNSLLAIVFLFITSPIGGHLMGRAAYLSGVKPTE